MAISVSSLSVYTDETSFGLAKQAILGSDDIQYFDVRTNVVGTLQLNRVVGDMTGTNTYCPEGDSGTTTFTGNILAPCPINFVTRDCARQLQEYWQGKFIAAETMGEDFGDLTDMIMEERMERVERVLSLNRWQGAKSSPAYASTSYVLCDGVLQQAYELSATTAANVAKTAFTQANSIVVLDSIISNIPQAVKQTGNARLFVSPANYETINLAYRGAFGTSTQFDANPSYQYSIKHPGSQVFITKINGLDGVADGTALATHKGNMVLGTLANLNNMNVKLAYDLASDKVIFRANFYQGVQFVNAEEVVLVK